MIDPTHRFAKQLQKERLARNLNQKKFAEQIHYSPQHLCDLEAGRRMPSVVFVDNLCSTFCLTATEWHRLGAQAHGWRIR